MRIALISTPFVSVPPKSYGGTELVVHELACGLVARGHDVTLFATGDSDPCSWVRALYPRAQWPPEMLADLNHTTWAMQQVVEHGPYDLVHAHSAVALGLARLVPHIPMVYTLHHERELHLSAFYRYRQDVYYVAISRDQLEREVALQHAQVIYHGLDPAKYQATPRAAGDYVCFIGRFARVKGPHVAIDVAERAGVPIHVAGEVHEPDRPWADIELDRRFRRPHVHTFGSVGLAIKAPMLRDARALLAPIEWNEPFGLILIEAMLSGCPVVAFPRGSVPELVEEGITGFIATSAEHMAELIRPGGPVDCVDRLRCRERAIERFSRGRMVADHVRMYERIVARRRTPAARLLPRRVLA
jgi:glycosyltransferase involved in cell wall biosynthesis